MAIRFALFRTPLIAGAVLVLVMNAVDASPGVAMAGLGIVAVASGTALGFHADRLFR